MISWHFRISLGNKNSALSVFFLPNRLFQHSAYSLPVVKKPECHQDIFYVPQDTEKGVAFIQAGNLGRI